MTLKCFTICFSVFAAMFFTRQLALSETADANKTPFVPSKPAPADTEEDEDVVIDDEGGDEGGEIEEEEARIAEVDEADDGVYLIGEDGVAGDAEQDEEIAADEQDDDTAIKEFLDDEDAAKAATTAAKSAPVVSPLAKPAEKTPAEVKVATSLTPEQVKAAQAALAKQAGANAKISVDGKVGKQTAKAIEEFQRKEKLPVSGVFDQATLQKLGQGKG